MLSRQQLSEHGIRSLLGIGYFANCITESKDSASRASGSHRINLAYLLDYQLYMKTGGEECRWHLYSLK